MKIAIIGSRSYNYFNEAEFVIKKVIETEKLKLHEIEIVSGLARGADTLGEEFAKKYNLVFHPFPANWDKYGKGAGHIRNKQMAELSDIVIAFWDGVSTGTIHMIKTSHSLGKKVWVYNFAKEKLMFIK